MVGIGGGPQSATVQKYCLKIIPIIAQNISVSSKVSVEKMVLVTVVLNSRTFYQHIISVTYDFSKLDKAAVYYFAKCCALRSMGLGLAVVKSN